MSQLTHRRMLDRHSLRSSRSILFDFSYLGVALPGNLPALLNWIPNWLGGLGRALQIVGGVIAVIVTTVKFVKVNLQATLA